MDFSHKKLPKEVVSTLRRVPVGVFAPHAILLTPLYVFLPKNQKFVAIKAPLQFFSPEELEKFNVVDNFYVPEFIDLIAPFQNAGEAVRELLKIREVVQVRTSQGAVPVSLTVSQYELNDAVLRVIATLWGDSVRVEPFFLCTFADEVCDALRPDIILRAAERDVELFELGLLRSSMAVFLALHLGYAHAHALTYLRERVFDDSFSRSKERPVGLVPQLVSLVRALIPDAGCREISANAIRAVMKENGVETASVRKLLCRIESVLNKKLIRSGALSPSLYGGKGIRDE